MNQKLENLLNLALETPETIRVQTDNLNVGFDSEEQTWELIVKYHGSLDDLAKQNIRVEYLIAGYAILTVPQQLVESVAELEEIEYVEKPKRYYYSPLADRGLTMAQIAPSEFAGADFLADACIYPVTRREPYLTGEGVLIAVIDSGIDYERKEFRTEDGSTRILYLWDQTSSAGTPPEGFAMGSEYTKEQIDAALSAATPAEKMMLVPSIDASGHGTAVAGIAAGYSTSPSAGTQYEGVAPSGSLLVVKLGLPREEGFPRTTEIMRGVTYAVRKGLELNMPLVINLSFGNSYGSHDGSSLLERFLDNASEIGRTVICVGSGNEGNSAGHAAGNALSSPVTVELAVASYEPSLSIQLWTQYSDSYRITLRSPGGSGQELPFNIASGKYTLRIENTDLLVYLGDPSPYSVDRELYIEMLPVGGPYIGSGLWQFILEPLDVTVGQYYFYLPSSSGRNERTGFTSPTPQVTLTIPSTSAKVITVGAYDSTFDSYADFSGRGYEVSNRTIGVVTAGLIKPDLAAPGVNLPAPDLYGGYQPVTGTSFATPVVSGSAALLMEWGIVRGNDRFLYGEKIKAYFRRGARPLRGEPVYPNNRVGFGALCTAESLPI